MKKKISILALTLLFLVSITGMPVWSHYCEMMGEKMLTECEACAVETETSSACCSDEIINDNLKFSADNSSCCVYEFDYKKIDDDYSQTFNSNPNIISLAVVIINSATIGSDKTETHTKQNNYNLPPPKFGKQLLQTIHQLKIDTPFC